MRRLATGTLATLVAVVALSGCSMSFAPVGDSIARPRVSASPVVAPDPAVDSITPASGSLMGGETVTVTGAALDDVTRVTFNGVDAADVAVVDDESVTATVPRAAEYQPATGTVEVFAGEEPVPSASPVSYSWAAATPVDNQLEYAFRHWSRESYNLAAYGTFNPVGGDCMNFVSQTLVARGLPMTDDWFFEAGGGHSESWTYAPTFDTMLANNPQLGYQRLTLEQRDQVEVGDIVVFDWNNNASPNHVQIVSSIDVVDGVTKILMVGHNIDSNWRDLDVAITTDHPGGTAWFWKVPDPA